MKVNKARKKKHKNRKFAYIISTLFTLYICMFFIPGYTPYVSSGDNFYHVQLNGVDVGTVDKREEAEEMLWNVRKNIAAENKELTFLEASLSFQGEEMLWGFVDEAKDVESKMEAVLREAKQDTLHRSYTLKMNEYMVNMYSADQVQSLLQAAINQYGADDAFKVALTLDDTRKFNITTAHVLGSQEVQEQSQEIVPLLGGVDQEFIALNNANEEEETLDFDSFEYGLLEMDFDEDVEIVEAYLPTNQLTTLETAIDEVVKEQETPSIYTVVAGDTLSEIALKVNIPMDKIVEMNSEVLESESSPIRVGDELVITVPQPELSVKRTERNYYEESYDADTVYIDNDNWYTYEMVVHQQPSAGFRRVATNEHYLNDKLVDREILKEEVVMEAVPKIVERGTKIPPTYIKPISGGRFTSGFGKRKAPTKGASTYHKGVDWAVPVGTAVYASCGGTVVRAGWGSGYGYCVYINHEDGRQTRYGHCSKVLVTVGQKVKQGDKIALSGNTGVTSGPHVHFEILIGGSQVDPLKYLQ